MKSQSISFLHLAAVLSVLSLLKYTPPSLCMKRTRNTYESQNLDKKEQEKSLREERAKKRRKLQELKDWEENKFMFFEAAEHGNLPKIKAILKLYPKMVNAKWEDTPYAQYEIKKKYGRNRPNYLYDKDSVLHIACKNGNSALVQFLLSQGARANASGFGKDTPLHLACTCDCEDVDIIKILVSHGADVNAIAKHKTAPLHNAATYNETPDIVKFLVSQGANIKACTTYHSIPVTCAYQDVDSDNDENSDQGQDQSEVVKFLEYAEFCQVSLEQSTEFLVRHVTGSKIKNKLRTKIESEIEKTINFAQNKTTPTYAIQNALIDLIALHKKNPKIINKKKLFFLCEKIPFNKRLFGKKLKNIRNFILQNHDTVKDMNKRTLLDACILFCKEKNWLIKKAGEVIAHLFPIKVGWRNLARNQLVKFLDNNQEIQENKLLELMNKAKSQNKQFYQILLNFAYLNCIVGQGKNPELTSQIVSFLDNDSLNEIVTRILERKKAL